MDEGRRESWTDELKAHINNLRGGKGESGEKFSYRLIGSAVADVHHILVRGDTGGKTHLFVWRITFYFFF